MHVYAGPAPRLRRDEFTEARDALTAAYNAAVALHAASVRRAAGADSGQANRLHRTVRGLLEERQVPALLPR